MPSTWKTGRSTRGAVSKAGKCNRVKQRVEKNNLERAIEGSEDKQISTCLNIKCQFWRCVQ